MAICYRAVPLDKGKDVNDLVLTSMEQRLVGEDTKPAGFGTSIPKLRRFLRYQHATAALTQPMRLDNDTGWNVRAGEPSVSEESFLGFPPSDEGREGEVLYAEPVAKAISWQGTQPCKHMSHAEKEIEIVQDES